MAKSLTTSKNPIFLNTLGYGVSLSVDLWFLLSTIETNIDFSDF